MVRLVTWLALSEARERDKFVIEAGCTSKENVDWS